MVSAVGTILIFPIVGALSAIGWRMGFVPCLCAPALLPFVLTLPREDVVPVANHDCAPRLREGLGASPGLLAVTAFVGLTMFVGPMFAPFYLAAIDITDPKLASLPLSAMSFASLVTMSVFGRLHDRFGTTALFEVFSSSPASG